MYAGAYAILFATVSRIAKAPEATFSRFALSPNDVL
jgi:hypothetical protein